MRFMLTLRVPPEEGNAAMKDGRFMSAFQSVMEELQPEAAYFAEIEGARGGYVVVNMDDDAQIPAICEPLIPWTGRDCPNSPRVYSRRHAQDNGGNRASEAEVRLGWGSSKATLCAGVLQDSGPYSPSCLEGVFSELCLVCPESLGQIA
jgi:hypothetical protein